MTPKRKKTWTLSRRDEFRTLALILTGTAIPVVGSLLFVTTSTLPSFGMRTFKGNTEQLPIVGWPTLGHLFEKDAATLEAWKVQHAISVRVPGYAILYDQIPDALGSVDRFLLVPDAGNLLHPPHRYVPAKAVIVRLTAGNRLVIRERVPYWAIGHLAIHRVTNSSADAGFTMLANEVRILCYTLSECRPLTDGEHGVSLGEVQNIFDQAYIVDRKTTIKNCFVQWGGASAVPVRHI